jgi:predicted dithiol-disulfide oxidoreductase (DUF899 family)
MSDHKIVSREEWIAAREELLAREKEHTRLGDELAGQRRELPWVALEKQYTLQTADGPRALAELFAGRSQLLIYHFMFGPSYKEGCPTNSSIADAINGLLPHLQARDITLMLVSGAPIEKLLAYRERMGWDLNWASSFGSDFDLELGFSSRARRRNDLPDLFDHRSRRRVPDDLLRGPRPRGEGARRGRGVPAVDPAPRRVRPRAITGHKIELVRSCFRHSSSYSRPSRS